MVARLDEPDRRVGRRLDDVDGRVCIEAHLEMGEEDDAGRGPAHERRDRRRVEMPGSGRHRAGPEGHLDEERVAGPDERREILRPSAIPGVDEAGSGTHKVLEW